jgi:hypothetical protein
VERGGLRTFLKEKSSLSAFEPVALFFFDMGISLSELEEYSEPEAMAKRWKSGLQKGRQGNRTLDNRGGVTNPHCDRDCHVDSHSPNE